MRQSLGWLARLWLVVRLGAWLTVLPIRLHRHSLPGLLQRLTPRRPCLQRSSPLERDVVVRLVMRLCRWRCFRGRLFPRLCVRQSLALYHVLAWLGEPVVLHVGVSKKGKTLRGHSWVTVGGAPLGEPRRPEEAFQTIYACSASRAGDARQEVALTESRVERREG
jgi:Transglutaminase-like superfamily